MNPASVQKIEGIWLKIAAAIFAAGVAYNRLNTIDARLTNVEARVEKIADYLLPPRNSSRVVIPRERRIFGELAI